jgi:A/G-specific adenine glycosylase
MTAFVTAVWGHYGVQGRDLPWRRTHDPYEILVSEVMLQQTQVSRVVVKYAEFLALFPTLMSLADASLASVLSAWSGLGYNRRALSLQQAAQMVVAEYGARIPDSIEGLRRLPGVGPATAAAVCVFAFDQAHPFIETNIRSAFIHFFFSECTSVPDADILPLVETTLDRERPREWFYALMDYGVWVKKAYGNPGRNSRHHLVQTPFAGSRREVRSRVLQVLLALAPSGAGLDALLEMLPGLCRPRDELEGILEDLVREGFLRKQDEVYGVASSAPVSPASSAPTAPSAPTA